MFSFTEYGMFTQKGYLSTPLNEHAIVGSKSRGPGNVRMATLNKLYQV